MLLSALFSHGNPALDITKYGAALGQLLLAKASFFVKTG